MKTIYKFLIVFVAIFLSSVAFSGCIEKDSVTYEVTFDATWSEATHPDDFPPNPHFSPLIGASHNEDVTFWEEGGLASPGIKNMAETGQTSPLDTEIRKAQLKRTAYKLIEGSGVPTSPGSTSIEFMVSPNYPLVTLVTMIAPSPDWFVGVNSLNLMENGSFVDELVVTLYAYDAGTDSGTNYTSPDDPTDPQEEIFLIEGYPFYYEDEIVPCGTFTFRKIKENNTE